MRIAKDDLGLRHLTVIYPGPKRYSLQKNIEVVPVSELASVLD
jgi:hypothetical protein